MVDTTDSSFVPRTERSDSTSSASSASSAGSAASPRRASHGVLFEGLQNQKRNNDPASVARRQSMNEQRPKPGFIGQMWNNWVRGTTP
jgi:hypothetical protein